MESEKKDKRDQLGSINGEEVAKIKVRTWKQSTEIATGNFYKDDLSKPGHME